MLDFYDSLKAEKARYKCMVCGYVYDPEIGDVKGKIPKGMAFLELTESWLCPLCRGGKDKFRKLEPNTIWK